MKNTSDCVPRCHVPFSSLSNQSPADCRIQALLRNLLRSRPSEGVLYRLVNICSTWAQDKLLVGWMGVCPPPTLLTYIWVKSCSTRSCIRLGSRCSSLSLASSRAATYWTFMYFISALAELKIVVWCLTSSSLYQGAALNFR